MKDVAIKQGSRRALEGAYVGRWRGLNIRRHKQVPALFVADEQLFPPCAPYVDSIIAWMTISDRYPDQGFLPRGIGYVSKADRALANAAYSQDEVGTDSVG